MPIDAEELIRQHLAAKAAWKPKFKTRKQREAEAAERAKKEAEEKAKKEEEAAARRHSKQERSRVTEKEREKEREKVRAKEREKEKESWRWTWKERVPGQKRTADEIEEDQWRERYLGPPVGQFSKFSAARKRARLEKDKFNFDWDPLDDTTRLKDDLLRDPNNPWNNLPRSTSPFDDAAEQRAKLLSSGWDDPERAKGYMDDFYAGRRHKKEREERLGWGKHWSQKALDDMRERDWRIFKDDFGISTKGGNIPNPMRDWKESGLDQRLLSLVARVGYREPTPIQRAAIPIALESRDLIGVAVTGSGKTASFLLPLLEYILDLPPLTEMNKNDGPYALVLAPTRELVQQIETEAQKFAGPLGFKCVSIVGGHSLEEQSFALRNGAEIIVATPGRLIDCLERRILVLSQCCYVIMDEADRMIDLGFEESVNKILDALPVSNEKPDTKEAANPELMKVKRHLGGKDRYRQTMMYTATMPTQVERIAKKYLRRPAIVNIGNIGEAVDTVEQRVEFINGEEKRKSRLQDILRSGEFAPPIIVFVNVKRNCDAVARDVRQSGYSSVSLHGSKTQDQREAALLSVRKGETDVLVATDLAGRGIDVADVSLVVNFNMALGIDKYTHRIGRTGRAGKSGVAITFIGNEDADVMYDLKQILTKSSISRVPDELRNHEAAQQRPTKGGK